MWAASRHRAWGLLWLAWAVPWGPPAFAQYGYGAQPVQPPPAASPPPYASAPAGGQAVQPYAPAQPGAGPYAPSGAVGAPQAGPPLGTPVPITFVSEPPGYTLYRLLEGGVGAGVSTAGMGAGTNRRFAPLCTAPCRLTLTVGGHLLGVAQGMAQPRWVSVEVPAPGLLHLFPQPVPTGHRWWWHVLDALARWGGLALVAAHGVEMGLIASGEEGFAYGDLEGAAIGGGISAGLWLLYVLLVSPPRPYRVHYVQVLRWEPYPRQ